MRHTKRKRNSWLLAVLTAVLLMTSSAMAAESGTCGANLSWTLEDGTLTITGTGEMTDFTEMNLAPWYTWRNEIVRLSLPEGLTSIGNLAFYGCKELKTVVLPDSVMRVGHYAFMDCVSLTILDMGSGVQTVGESAFSDCYALRSLDLPAGLRTIGLKSFYRCESITTLTIPYNVSSVGISAFGYCKSLVTVEILAHITEVPEFMFYGCGNLVSITLPSQLNDVSDHAFRGCDQLGEVYFDGKSKTLEKIQKTVPQAVVSNNTLAPVVSAGTSTLNGDGTVTQENITVIKSENASVSTKVEHTHREDTTEGGTLKSQIQVTVSNKKAWEEAKALVTDSLADLKGRLSVEGEAPQVDVNVYVKGTDTVDKQFVEAVAGENVRLEVTTSGGAGWKMDLSEVNKEDLSGEYDLSFYLIPAPQEVRNQLGTPHVVQVKFNSNAQMNAEVLIALGQSWARQDAVLYQRLDDLNRCQTVVVDGSGCAHFYLGAVSSDVDYYIARALPVVQEEKKDQTTAKTEAIIPTELYAEYGVTDNFQKVEYVITGRKSSWGMNINQVTWIMAGVMGGAVAVVGVTMYLLNKRKLKMGYVPDLDEEE